MCATFCAEKRTPILIARNAAKTRRLHFFSFRLAVSFNLLANINEVSFIGISFTGFIILIPSHRLIRLVTCNSFIKTRPVS